MLIHLMYLMKAEHQRRMQKKVKAHYAPRKHKIIAQAHDAHEPRFCWRPQPKHKRHTTIDDVW